MNFAEFMPRTHKCEACGRLMTDRTRKFCNILCRNRGMALRMASKCAAKRKLVPMIRCAREGCENEFEKRPGHRKFCSVKCWAMTRQRVLTIRQKGPTTLGTDRGAAICPVHHRALAFGSHPLSGASMQWCPVCGWKLLERIVA